MAISQKLEQNIENNNRLSAKNDQWYKIALWLMFFVCAVYAHQRNYAAYTHCTLPICQPICKRVIKQTVKTDEMPHNVAFPQGLNWFAKKKIFRDTDAY